MKYILLIIALCILAFIITYAMKASEPQKEETQPEDNLQDTSAPTFEKDGYIATDLYYNVKGTIHRIYKSKKGAYFIFRTKVRDGSEYKDYLDQAEVQEAITKEEN